MNSDRKNSLYNFAFDTTFENVWPTANLIWMSNASDSEGEDDSSIGIATQERVKTQRPSMYKVVLLNDDFTPMDFVVHILKTFFSRSDAEAVDIMMQVHNKGCGVAGVYQFDIAEMKVQQVNNYSRRHEHPLKCVVEKE